MATLVPHLARQPQARCLPRPYRSIGNAPDWPVRIYRQGDAVPQCCSTALASRLTGLPLHIRACAAISTTLASATEAPTAHAANCPISEAACPKETAPAWGTLRPKFGASFVPMGGPTQLIKPEGQESFPGTNVGSPACADDHFPSHLPVRRALRVDGVYHPWPARRGAPWRFLWPRSNKTFVPASEPCISIYLGRNVALALLTGAGYIS
jgi:hypothetical protein